MNRLIFASLILTTLLWTTHVEARETVARWVDADGVTHYGNVQFAPTHAVLEVVGPANAMDAPEVQNAPPAANGPAWSLISRPPKQNPKGWRARGDGVQNGPINH